MYSPARRGAADRDPGWRAPSLDELAPLPSCAVLAALLWNSAMQSLVAHGCPPQQRSPLSPDEVYSALTASLSADGTTRTQAQALLQEWEADSSPGFIGSLLNIVHEVNSVPEVRHAGCGHAPCMGLGNSTA